MYVSVVFVIRCLYSAVSLTLVREQRFIKKKKDVFCRHNQVFVATKIWGNVGGKKVGFL